MSKYAVEFIRINHGKSSLEKERFDIPEVPPQQMTDSVMESWLACQYCCSTSQITVLKVTHLV